MSKLYVYKNKLNIALGLLIFSHSLLFVDLDLKAIIHKTVPECNL